MTILLIAVAAVLVLLYWAPDLRTEGISDRDRLRCDEIVEITHQQLEVLEQQAVLLRNPEDVASVRAEITRLHNALNLVADALRADSPRQLRAALQRLQAE